MRERKKILFLSSMIFVLIGIILLFMSYLMRENVFFYDLCFTFSTTLFTIGSIEVLYWYFSYKTGDYLESATKYGLKSVVQKMEDDKLIKKLIEAKFEIILIGTVMLGAKISDLLQAIKQNIVKKESKSKNINVEMYIPDISNTENFVFEVLKNRAHHRKEYWSSYKNAMNITRKAIRTFMMENPEMTEKIKVFQYDTVPYYTCYMIDQRFAYYLPYFHYVGKDKQRTLRFIFEEGEKEGEESFDFLDIMITSLEHLKKYSREVTNFTTL